MQPSRRRRHPMDWTPKIPDHPEPWAMPVEGRAGQPRPHSPAHSEPWAMPVEGPRTHAPSAYGGPPASLPLPPSTKTDTPPVTPAPLRPTSETPQIQKSPLIPQTPSYLTTASLSMMTTLPSPQIRQPRQRHQMSSFPSSPRSPQPRSHWVLSWLQHNDISLIGIRFSVRQSPSQQTPTQQGWSARVRVMASALQHRNYRVYWFGQVAFVLGFQILQVAQLWLVYSITGSYVKLGLVGASLAVPTILISMFGGVIADRVDKRKLLMTTQTVMALVVFAIAALAYFDLVRFEHLVAMAIVNGLMAGLGQPSQQALIPQLIERKDLMNAVALNSAVWQGTRIIGPGIGGVVIDLMGTAPTFVITGVGFTIYIVALGMLRLERVETPQRSAPFFKEMAGGISFIARRSIFASLIGMSFFNAFFGFAYIGILAGFAQDVLELGGSGLGLLMGASGIGALTGTLVQGSMGGVRRRGWVIIIGSVLFGVFLILFSMSRIFPLSLFLLLLVGASNSAYMIPLMTQLQASVPDELRGRVMGVFSMTYSMMPLGSLPMGAVAGVFGAPAAIASGAAAVVLFSLGVAAKSKDLRQLEIHSDAPDQT